MPYARAGMLTFGLILTSWSGLWKSHSLNGVERLIPHSLRFPTLHGCVGSRVYGRILSLPYGACEGEVVMLESRPIAMNRNEFRAAGSLMALSSSGSFCLLWAP